MLPLVYECEGVKLSEARNAVLPSALANRIKELVHQSRRCQEDTARIDAEIRQLHEHIAALKPTDEKYRCERR
jgi:hypothetical protein